MDQTNQNQTTQTQPAPVQPVSPPAYSQLPQQPVVGNSSNQGLVAALSYLFSFLSAILVLLLSKDKFVRFHAFQSLFLGLAFFVLGFVLGLISPILAVTLTAPIQLVGLVLTIFLMYKSFKMEEFKLPVIGDFAKKAA